MTTTWRQFRERMAGQGLHLGRPKLRSAEGGLRLQAEILDAWRDWVCDVCGSTDTGRLTDWTDADSRAFVVSISCSRCGHTENLLEPKPCYRDERDQT